MSYEELSLNGFIKEIKEVSSGPRQRKVCFVLGAGASKESGIKSGQELVKIWEEDLLERNKEAHLKWKEKAGITDENKYEFYSEYYERRFKNITDGYNYLEKLMESARPSIGYVVLSYILTHTPHNVVITTNFDHLLEDAVKYYENEIPLVIGHESLAHYVTKQIHRPMIIKIHRDLLLDPKNRAAELNTLHESWKEALDTVFSEYYPIFIGYAGNDHSLMDYLIGNSDIFSAERGIFPYWMIYKTDKMSEMVLKFIDSSGGYLIKHNGFDEVLCLLGNKFDYKLPAKEDFIRDAVERHKTLSNSFKIFKKRAEAHKEMDQNDNTEEKSYETSKVVQAVQNITGELQELFRKAEILEKEGNYEEAMDSFEKLAEIDSQNASYYARMGTILHKLENYESARKEKQRAVELDPGCAEYHGSLGETLYELGEYKEAQDEITKALELAPDHAKYHGNLGKTLHKLRRYEEAAKEEQRALELEPDCAEYHGSLGETLHELGRYEEALEEEGRALELDSDRAEYHGNLGKTLYELSRNTEAKAEIERALELAPARVEYHKDLALVLYGMGKVEDALKEIEGVIKLDTRNAEYYNCLGLMLHDLGRYEEALEKKQRALELDSDPAHAEYHNSVGITLHELGRYEEALEEIKKAIDLEPDNEKYQNSYGETKYELENSSFKSESDCCDDKTNLPFEL